MRHANPSILALDIGTHCGWALTHAGKRVSGTYHNKVSRFEGGGMRYLRFRKEFLLNFGEVREVVFEEVRRHEGTDAAHIYGGLLATLSSWCEERSIPYRGVGVGEVKKFWTGKGNADKAAMMAAAVKRGYNPCDDNEADAIAILEWALGPGRVI